MAERVDDEYVTACVLNNECDHHIPEMKRKKRLKLIVKKIKIKKCNICVISEMISVKKKPQSQIVENI